MPWVNLSDEEKEQDRRDGIAFLTKYLNWDAIVRDAKVDYDNCENPVEWKEVDGKIVTYEVEKGVVEEFVEQILDQIREQLSSDDTRLSETIETFVKDNTIKIDLP